MKLSCNVVLTNASTRLDGSLGIRLATPELKPDEKVAFMELQGRNLNMVLEPMDDETAELKEIKGKLDEKTPSQRLRAVLFIWWKQQHEAIDFEVFYKAKMEGLIEHIKTKLYPE